MGLLRHLRGGGETSTNGPDGFVGNRHIGPILLAKNGGGCLELFGADVHGRSSLTFLLLLSDAKHNLKTLGKCQLRLLGNKFAVLTSHSEPLTAFGVTKNHPRDTHILELTGGDLAGVGAGSRQTAVLGGNFNILPQRLKGDRDVNEGGTHDNLGVGRDGSSGIEFSDELLERGDSSIGLPVSSDEVGTRAIGSGATRGGAFRTGAGIRERHCV
mmetsp:Transcript_9601/g.17333  ORF Transcript_9601/g.17333 Transcript_9601/m.17333 type:complete len:214 (+) Transcript_9601:307-948(+)